MAPVYEPGQGVAYPKPTAPKMTVEPPTISRDRWLGPAAPLYRKAKILLEKKAYRQAELSMERALRIEPKNGYYWYTLAEIKHAERQYSRSIQLCLKSKSLAGGDLNLIRLNEQLMAKSR